MSKIKSFIDSVEVKTPCSEKWDEMSGNDKVRFCSHCAKHVTNLSEVTRKDALRLVRASGGNMCIRYHINPETRRPMFADQMFQITRRAPGLAAGVMSASFGMSMLSYAQEAAPPTEPTGPTAEVVVVKVAEEIKDVKPNGSIKGTVTDPMGAVIPGAIVVLVNQTAETARSMKTSADGSYEFNAVPPGSYLVRFVAQGPGFAPAERRNIDISNNEKNVDMTLTLAEPVVMGVWGSIEYKTELAKAVSNDDMDLAKELIIGGAKVNGKDENYGNLTPLFVAVENGNLKMIDMLLGFGAKVNARDTEKQTPLMRLDYDATPEVVELLIRHGAKLDAEDKEGNTALIYAANSVDAKVLQALIDAGADVNRANKDGDTALINAASSGDIERVRVLILAGAEVNAKNDDGDTAIDQTDDAEIEVLLVKYGAQRREQKDESDVPQQPGN